MRFSRQVAIVSIVLALAAEARAGLYYSGEHIADLPSQWNGFLLDQRLLRKIAAPATKASPASPARLHFLEGVAKLEKIGGERPLTADELADLGALYVRLGSINKAVTVLRSAHHLFPKHFCIVANLGTAWQLQGDQRQAIAALEQAVRLAPGKLRKAEEAQLKLVRARQKQPKAQGLDDLFGVRYLEADGRFAPGKMAAQERLKLPVEAAALVQQLALWLPSDGPLLWQMAELANAHGDVRLAAAMFDGCVDEFGMSDPELRHHRRETREAADALAKTTSPDEAKAAHRVHAMPTRSKRPLLTRLDNEALPTIVDQGVNTLPWTVLAETSVDRKFKPTFGKYLRELDGKQVSLVGYMQPLREDLDVSGFMFIENPVGCWYCEMPELASIILVQMPSDKTTPYTRGRVKIVGKLKLNTKDPENFLYTIGAATVAELE